MGAREKWLCISYTLTRHPWMPRKSKGAAAYTEPRGDSPACSPWGWAWRRPRRWGKEKRAVTGVAVQTGAGLLYCLLPFAIGMVVKHEGMATVLTQVAGKGIPGPPRFQAGALLQAATATITERGAACDGVRGMASLPAVAGTLDIRGAAVGVVLEGKILASHCQIFPVICQLD